MVGAYAAVFGYGLFTKRKNSKTGIIVASVVTVIMMVLAVYLCTDYDLYSRVKFMVIACLLLRELGGDFLETAQLFSKEIENDADNMDTLLDAAYDSPAFTDAKLLGMLL